MLCTYATGLGVSLGWVSLARWTRLSQTNASLDDDTCKTYERLELLVLAFFIFPLARVQSLSLHLLAQ